MIDKEKFLEILKTVIKEISEDESPFKDLWVNDSLRFARFDTINNDSFKTYISIEKI